MTTNTNTAHRSTPSTALQWIDDQAPGHTNGAQHKPAETRQDRTVYLAILSVYLLITVPLSIILNLWIDEAYSLHSSSRGLSFALTQARDFEMQPPFYFLLLTVWRQMGDSIFIARLLSLLCGLATLVVAREISKRWLPSISPNWILAPLAVSSIVVYAAVEVRLYSLALLESALLILLFFDGFLSDRPRTGARLMYIVVAALSLYTYYFVGFLLAAHGLTLIVLGLWRRTAIYSGAMVITLALFSPGLLDVFRQTSDMGSEWNDAPSLVRAAVLAGGRLFSLPLSTFRMSSAVRWATMIGSGAFFAAIIAIYWRRATSRTFAIWMMAGVVTALHILAIYFVTGENHMLPRHNLVALVPGLLLALSTIELLGPRKKLALRAWVGLATACGIFALGMNYSSLAKFGDYKRVSRYVAQHSIDDEPVFVYVADAALPFEWHFQGPGKIVPLPAPLELKTYDLKALRPESSEQIASIIETNVGSRDAFWVFNDRPPNRPHLGTDLHLDRIEDALSQGYVLDGEKEFYRGRLRHFRRN